MKSDVGYPKGLRRESHFLKKGIGRQRGPSGVKNTKVSGGSFPIFELKRELKLAPSLLVQCVGDGGGEGGIARAAFGLGRLARGD